MGRKVEATVSKGSKVHREGLRGVVKLLLYTEADVGKVENDQCIGESIQRGKKENKTDELF